jgi:hypothetical protein
VPIQTQVGVPAGTNGTLAINLQATGGSAPSGYSFFGQQVVLTGPVAASASSPYVITFTVDASLLGDVAPADMQIFRNGAVVGGCRDATAAIPNPCVASKSVGAGGDAVIVVRTTAFSTWNPGRLAFGFSGFFAPIANPPTLNNAQAGSTVALSFSLGGNRGLDVIASGFPRVASFSCPTPPAGLTGSSVAGSLSYDTKSNRYTYSWKSDKTATGCRQLTIRFRDGTTKRALFKFTR